MGLKPYSVSESHFLVSLLASRMQKLSDKSLFVNKYFFLSFKLYGLLLLHKPIQAENSA